ncbi:MAG: hypothetical protein JWP75_3407 [Frondihabitans sp.]|nr:hypothetical protein [Frondihabitans sp.]
MAQSDPRSSDVRSAYDTVADSYARILADTSYEAPLDLALVDEFARQTGDGARILDAGCGAGRMITYLDGIGRFDIEGADLSPAMIARARHEHPGRRFHTAALTDLPFAEGSLDGVLCWYSIIHTPTAEIPEILREIRRILRPGGSALLAFQAGTGVRRIEHAYGHDVALTAYLHDDLAVIAAMEAAGYVIEARLLRGPRTTESHSQGFVLARSSAAGGDSH